MRGNLAGRIAAYFLTSKLTPVIVIAISAWGLIAIAFTPRQENPQIKMPAATIVTRYPGASAAEVQRLITEPGERVLQEVPGIEHVYATSTQDASIVTVLFHVGDDPTTSFVDLYHQIDAHRDRLLPGAAPPQITPLSVDDIPIVVLTLHGRAYDRGQLDDAAQRVIDALRPIDGVSTIDEYGGLHRQVNVTLDPARLAAFGLTPAGIAQAIGAANVVEPVGSVRDAASDITVHAGTAFATPEQVAAQIVGIRAGRPIALGQVAGVTLGRQATDAETRFGRGAGLGAGSSEPSVSIAVAKKAGTNAVGIADAVRRAVEHVELPPGVSVAVTRDYGAKANDAVNELIQRLMEAIGIVVVLLLLALGWREALVVATAIPLTLFVALGVGMLAGQTVNRITLFALILALGLLVDDAIVLVENIHRHYGMRDGRSRAEATVAAVAEVGSPTTLATLTVMLSFLPMLFVTGMMGPYMRPIPLNVPVAMLASLGIAFVVTPWATYALLRTAKAVHAGGTPRWVVPVRRVLANLLARPRRGSIVLALLLLAFCASAALPVVQLLHFRMLPDANETTFLVSIDAPPASTPAHTAAIAEAVGTVLARRPDVATYEIFSGTNSVPDLASLLQGTVFRNAPNLSDIRVDLVPKGERHAQSAAIVQALRPQLQAVAARYGADLRILQTPPGPPVRDTILAKIYGPDAGVRRAAAGRISALLANERGVVDVTSSFKALPASLQLEIDQRAAAVAGVSPADIAQTLAIGLRGAVVSTLHTPRASDPIGIFLRFLPANREDAAAFASIQVLARSGQLVPLSVLTHVVARQLDEPLYRDDFSDVAYVGADMAGRSSTYAVLDMIFALMRDPLPAGYHVDWDGEWSLTNTVFADLGRAMLVAFLLIYFVLVARFRSFTIPLVVLAAVPLAVIGVMPGFALLAPFGVYFSATAMIGLIALIGIVVRNSIILIEFIEDKRAQGSALHEALVEAAAARTRPIFLTAAAGVLSSLVIASDPVWSGLAWALVFGMTASAVLSVIAIPLLYQRVVRGTS
jgi:multidrug efflux pump subunit AcrB